MKLGKAKIRLFLYCSNFWAILRMFIFQKECKKEFKRNFRVILKNNHRSYDEKYNFSILDMWELCILYQEEHRLY